MISIEFYLKFFNLWEYKLSQNKSLHILFFLKHINLILFIDNLYYLLWD